MLEHNYAGPRYLTYRESFLRVSIRLTLCLFAAALIACLAACGSSTNLPGPPSGTQHLYVDGTQGHVLQFALPISGSSPSATLSLPTASIVAAVGGSISIFKGPITG